MKSKNKNDSLTDSLTFKAAEIGTNFALSFIPGANTVYELIRLSAQELEKYIVEQQQRKIIDFHKHLLESNSSEDTSRTDTYIEIADFHVLLNTCLQDTEDEKTKLYATLAQNAIYKKLSSKNLRFFCISLKEMSYDHLEEMRHAYIASKFHLIPTKGAGRVDINLSPEQASSELIYGRKLMELRGFTENGKINQLGMEFIHACYPSNKLLPTSIQRSEWKNPNSPILMLSYETSDPYVMELAEHLSNQLRKHGFKTTGLYAPPNKRPYLLPIQISIVIFKYNPERIIDNINNIDHLMGECCIAVQGCNEYPRELETLRNKFKEIININDLEPQIGATKIVNTIYKP